MLKTEKKSASRRTMGSRNGCASSYPAQIEAHQLERLPVGRCGVPDARRRRQHSLEELLPSSWGGNRWRLGSLLRGSGLPRCSLRPLQPFSILPRSRWGCCRRLSGPFFACKQMQRRRESVTRVSVRNLENKSSRKDPERATARQSQTQPHRSSWACKPFCVARRETPPGSCLCFLRKEPLFPVFRSSPSSADFASYIFARTVPRVTSEPCPSSCSSASKTALYC